ncbi:hypothetical protein TNCV_887071 [Trichonephila clavipes]|uniref:Uncharacterized protein n=1 Tax=Trichonephila clavipes TaxID=2585209 RepID=A0A8X6RD73_TRICX|nr:hypothetical protein TNCV_887071 [Trichonephila clavipes]
MPAVIRYLDHWATTASLNDGLHNFDSWSSVGDGTRRSVSKRENFEGQFHCKFNALVVMVSWHKGHRVEEEASAL